MLCVGQSLLGQEEVEAIHQVVEEMVAKVDNEVEVEKTLQYILEEVELHDAVRAVLSQILRRVQREIDMRALEDLSVGEHAMEEEPPVTEDDRAWSGGHSWQTATTIILSKGTKITANGRHGNKMPNCNGQNKRNNKYILRGTTNIMMKQRMINLAYTNTYGHESWTLLKSSIKRIEAFKAYLYRRALRILWTDMVTNNQVLDQMGTEPPAE
ncbi:hypothetical protein LAZ67_15000539 [Cordylochernes scorpioides]|uniref:Uncharacterized protein n=1 Tax=Cordylochernes scorpioides TaxID=51811 RepID=A0ABY6L8Y8_9ARAC|nr:hypothetical protein LAZ67_15000539 [Cordylochernes scorpioides]